MKLSKYKTIRLFISNFIALFALLLPLQAIHHNQIFTPTLQNLNTITLTRLSDQESKSNFQGVSALNLALTICDHYNDIDNSLILPLSTNNEKEYLRVYKGVFIPSSRNEQKDYITLYSRGFARQERPALRKKLPLYQKILSYLIPGLQERGLPKKGGGVLAAYAALRNKFIHTPCITFDYPDASHLVNLAQKIDLLCLDTILESIPANKKMIYCGTSRGASALLKHELQNNNNPCAMILESPFFSIKDTTAQLAKTCLWNIPFSSLFAYKLFRWLYPQYQPMQDNLLQLIPRINPQTPLFIIHLQNDPYVSDAGIFTMVNTLARYNSNVHLLVIKDTTRTARHGALNKIKPCQQAVNAFLKHYNLPYDKELAQQGQELLAQAKANAKASSPDSWKLTSCF